LLLSKMKLKLSLFIHKFYNFQHFKERDEDKYTSKVGKLLNAFQSWFHKFADHSNIIFLVTNSFNFLEEKLNYLEENLQLEITYLKCYLVLKC